MPVGATPESLTVGPSSTVRFLPLFIREPQRAGDDWIVGHEASDIAIELPIEGVAVIQSLESGATIAEATAAIHERYGEDVDVADLVLQLADAGLVAAIDARTLKPPRSIGQRWLERISPSWAAAVYSRPAIAVAATFAIVGLVLMAASSTVRPRAHDLYWSPSYALDMLTLVVLGPALILKHELGHLLAARKYGLAAELTLSYRLVYLVSVSQIAGVWRLPRRQRLFIYSAGMFNDLAVAGFCALLVLLAGVRAIPLPPTWQGLLRLVLLSEYLAVAWECQIFLKTDVYHIFADLTGRHDLPSRARALVLGLGRALDRKGLHVVHSLRRRPHPTVETAHRGVPRRDEDFDDRSPDWLLIGYTLLAVIGVSATLIWFSLYFIPATAGAIGGELARIGVGGTADQGIAVVDALIALVFQAGSLSFLFYNWCRSVRRYFLRRHTSPRPMVGTAKPFEAAGAE